MPRVRDYLLMLRNGWLVILAATALSVGAGWLAWQTTDPVYSSTARVFATTWPVAKKGDQTMAGPMVQADCA